MKCSRPFRPLTARWPEATLLGVALAVPLLWPDDAPTPPAASAQQPAPVHLRVALPGLPLDIAADPFGLRNWGMKDPVSEAAAVPALPTR